MISTGSTIGTAPAALERYAESSIPTEYGPFRILVYRFRGEEHCAVVRGEVDGEKGVLVRVHSECLTGEVLHSLKCDCREQLDLALRGIARAERGVVVYLRQEGRGIGLGNKIRAYALQQQGLDTVDANQELGFESDLRRYDVAQQILADLGVRSIQLMTNNPEKLAALRAGGIAIDGRVAIEIPPNEHNGGYLDTKRVRMGHMLGWPAASTPFAVTVDDAE